MPYSLREIAKVINTELRGDPNCNIVGVATIKNARSGDLTFLSNRRYFSQLRTTEASAVIVSCTDITMCPVNILVADDPYLAYVKAAIYINPEKTFDFGIHKTASLGENVTVSQKSYIGQNVIIGNNSIISDDVYIGAACVVGASVVIGVGTKLFSNVTLCDDVHIGKHTRIHPGVVIGADGFGIANDQGRWLKIPQLGSVRIGNDVEIGANTTIDRGAIEDTVIEDGVQIDNQVQIGHNVRVGAHTAIAGCTAVAGSVNIGKRCMIGGLSALAGHIEITDDVIVNGMSGVTNSIKQAGHYASAMTVMEVKLWRKNNVRFKRLDEFARRLIKLESKIT